jgi:lipoate-protein ligase A
MIDSSDCEMYPTAHWRVIVDGAADGLFNMAVDEAIAQAVASGQALSTLRLYGWEPGCLSLGYAQSASDVQTDALRARGWDVVRRLTGGRAILHIDEMTYSVVTPLDDPRVEGGVVESYRRLSRGLMAGLGSLGAAVSAGKGDGSARGFDGPVCFEVPSDYEITSQGKKLLGSAQTRRGGVVLQHGALPLWGDITRICDVLVFASDAEREEARTRLLSRAITLEEALGQRVSMEDVVEAMTDGFHEALCLTLQPGDLSPEERARAEFLRETKYASAEWTMRH